MDNGSDYQHKAKRIERKLRNSGLQESKSKFEHLKFTPSGNSDQSEFANSEAGRKAAKKLKEVRQNNNFLENPEKVRSLTLKEKNNLYNIKHNMKEKDMEESRKIFNDAEKMLRLRKLASAYIKSEAIDRDAQKFLEDLCEAHDKLAGEVLLRSFEKSFPEAAKVIRENPPFLQLAREAAGQGAKFAGYGEEGPAKMSRGQCVGEKVWVPKPTGDTTPWESAEVFLFELNNSLHQPQKEELEKKIFEYPPISADKYAEKRVALEVESILRMGKIWSEVKAKSTKPTELDKYDDRFFFKIYQNYEAKEITKDDIIQKVSEDEAANGKTYKEMFREQYYKYLNPHF